MRLNTRLDFDDISIEVTFKRIRNLHLRLCPPDAEPRISATERMSIADIRDFANSRLDWIRKHQKALLAEAREPELAYIDGESLSLWGEPIPIAVVESPLRPIAKLEGGRLLLRVRPGTDLAFRERLVDAFYKKRLEEAVVPLLERWQTRLGLKVSALSIRRMKTKWGSCFPARARIGLNSELAKRPPELLEYVLVHELVHLFEPDHGAGFRTRMTYYMPNWRELRERLNHPERAIPG